MWWALRTHWCYICGTCQPSLVFVESTSTTGRDLSTAWWGRGAYSVHVSTLLKYRMNICVRKFEAAICMSPLSKVLKISRFDWESQRHVIFTRGVMFLGGRLGYVLRSEVYTAWRQYVLESQLSRTAFSQWVRSSATIELLNNATDHGLEQSLLCKVFQVAETGSVTIIGLVSLLYIRRITFSLWRSESEWNEAASFHHGRFDLNTFKFQTWLDFVMCLHPI